MKNYGINRMRYFTFFYNAFSDKVSNACGTAGLKCDSMPDQNAVIAHILGEVKGHSPQTEFWSIAITGWEEMTKEDFEAFHGVEQ